MRITAGSCRQRRLVAEALQLDRAVQRRPAAPSKRPAGRLLAHPLDLDVIHGGWDDIVRCAASLRDSTVTASCRSGAPCGSAGGSPRRGSCTATSPTRAHGAIGASTTRPKASTRCTTRSSTVITASASVSRVRATNSRLTADFDVERAACSDLGANRLLRAPVAARRTRRRASAPGPPCRARRGRRIGGGSEVTSSPGSRLAARSGSGPGREPSVKSPSGEQPAGPQRQATPAAS
jgi:hypothetical protein